MTSLRLVLFFALIATATACGSGGSDSKPDAGFQTAPHTALPMLDKHSGAILDHVQLVTLTYTGYQWQSNVEAFGDYIVTSDWYTSVGAEYGVQAGTHAAKVDLGPPPATLKDTDIEPLLQQAIMQGKVPMPSATGNEYLYMLYVPSTVQLDASLQGFYGYHADTNVGSTYFPYAVVLDDGSGLGETTATAAHELIEAATDTLFVQNQDGDGWWADRALPDPWYLVETETADLCDGEALIQSGNFAVQRVWSNAAIMAGKSPCVPYDPDDTWMDVSADPATMPTIPPGGTATFTLTGWSTTEVPDWKLALFDADYSDLTSAQMHPMLSSTTINNGKTVTLTLSAPANAAHGALGGVYVLSGPTYRPWVVGFTVQ